MQGMHACIVIYSKGGSLEEVIVITCILCTKYDFSIPADVMQGSMSMQESCKTDVKRVENGQSGT